jgi:DNA gyrase subunit B
LLLTSATADASLYAALGAAPIQGATLEALALHYMEANSLIRRWGRRYDSEVLRTLMSMPPIAPGALEDAEHRRQLAQQLEQRLQKAADNAVVYRVRAAQGGEGTDPSLVVTREHHGAQGTKTLHAGFFRSPEYLRLTAIGTELKDVLREGAYVERGKERRDVQTFAEAIEWLMAQAKQGQTIQRYKGLGEMNPEQLWETTVNPETRRLMQVRIEDAVAADEIFTTLMGDQVEPRREFIERNALAVANLDV